MYFGSDLPRPSITSCDISYSFLLYNKQAYCNGWAVGFEFPSGVSQLQKEEGKERERERARVLVALHRCAGAATREAVSLVREDPSVSVGGEVPSCRAAWALYRSFRGIRFGTALCGAA